MYLRNGLLILSVLMIGFCLSLYFQGEESPGTFSWDQYKNLSYNEERSHSLADFNEKIAPLTLEGIIAQIYDKNHMAGEKTRVMEIGVGNGRVLMELKKRFPDVEFYGINKEKTHTFYRRESYILTALKFEILSKPELEDIELPYIVFEDLDMGNPIPYRDERFDLVFSQDTMKHIKYKFELWNEILRILRPGGRSIHTDVSGLTLYHKGVIMDTRDAFQELKRRGFEISTGENPLTVFFRRGDLDHLSFPVTPHQPLPDGLTSLSDEQRKPSMSYSID